MAVTSIEVAAERTKSSNVIEFLKRPARNLFIDGKWVSTKSGKTFTVETSGNQQVLATAAESGKKDMQEAVNGFRKSLDDGLWRLKSRRARTRVLLKFADLIEQHGDELGELVSLEYAKAKGEVALSAGLFFYYAEWVSRVYGESNRSLEESPQAWRECPTSKLTPKQPKTVGFHNIFRRLGLISTALLVRYAIRQGLIHP